MIVLNYFILKGRPANLKLPSRCPGTFWWAKWRRGRKFLGRGVLPEHVDPAPLQWALTSQIPGVFPTVFPLEMIFPPPWHVCCNMVFTNWTFLRHMLPPRKENCFVSHVVESLVHLESICVGEAGIQMRFLFLCGYLVEQMSFTGKLGHLCCGPDVCEEGLCFWTLVSLLRLVSTDTLSFSY